MRQGLIIYPWLAWNSLCVTGTPQIHRNPPVSFSLGLELKTCIITPSLATLFLETGSLSEPRAQGLAKLAGHCRDMLVFTPAALGYELRSLCLQGRSFTN